MAVPATSATGVSDVMLANAGIQCANDLKPPDQKPSRRASGG